MITKIAKVTSLSAREVGEGMEQRGLVVSRDIIPRKRKIIKIVAIARGLIKIKGR